MVNRITLIGNVGKNPEIKTLDSGMKVANFSLATTEKFKDKNGEKQSKTEWHNIVIWGKLAEIVESYVEKGSKLYLEGKLSYRSWETDGVKKYATDIVCSNMTMLGGNSPQGGEDEDNLPF